jgi:hypothetical protein
MLYYLPPLVYLSSYYPLTCVLLPRLAYAFSPINTFVSPFAAFPLLFFNVCVLRLLPLTPAILRFVLNSFQLFFYVSASLISEPTLTTHLLYLSVLLYTSSLFILHTYLVSVHYWYILRLDLILFVAYAILVSPFTCCSASSIFFSFLTSLYSFSSFI